jgi:hypothetical protein
LDEDKDEDEDEDEDDVWPFSGLTVTGTDWMSSTILVYNGTSNLCGVIVVLALVFFLFLFLFLFLFPFLLPQLGKWTIATTSN